MDVTDNADGSLDPRIQIELENLNDATDDINKLETELDEAHTAFRQLLSETTKRLKEILNKVGNSYVEKARCYYEALEVARQAQVKCQQQAQLFQRASEIHAAAKETVALAESRFMSHQHEWNFDQAWQDMLNHATLKVMDAENQKAECGREHYRRAVLFNDAEKKLLQLEEKHHRSIIKARPYFEVKAQCDQMLATQKERVECLQKAIQDAKSNYATSLRRLEEISNQIHQQRQDYDFIANGPREPGVGAELVSPQKTSNYDIEFNQSNSNRTKDIMNNQMKYNRIQDYDNSCQLQEDIEYLGKRSVDGSEAISSQWELELEANLENLNNLSLENSVLDHDSKNESTNLHFYNEENSKSNKFLEKLNYKFSQDKDHSIQNLKQSKNLFKTLKSPFVNKSLMTYFEEPRCSFGNIQHRYLENHIFSGKGLNFQDIYVESYSNEYPINNKKCVITYNRQTFRELFKVIYELTRESKEKKMDKENHRVNKANCNSIKNQNERAELKEQNDEKKIQENKNFRSGTTKEKEIKCEEDMKEDEELLIPHGNTMFGLCAICHLALGNINSNFSQYIPCSKGHAVCQRCIQHFALQSDPGCILCHAQYQQSNINLSRESNVSLNSIYTHLKRMQIPRQQLEYYSKHHQHLQQYIPIDIEQSYNKSWNQNYPCATQNIERNTLGYYNDYFEEISDYDQIKEQNNMREQRNKNCDKQRRQSYCNLFKKGNTESYMSEAKVSGQISAECSRRPIRCPRIDCAINVAFSALTHHFIFDHPEVPILNVEPGIKSTLIVSFSALSSNSSRCLALLLVSGKLSEPVARLFNGSQINPKYRNRLPLPVLAARLHCTDQCIPNDKINKKKNFREKDIIIAWVAGLDIGNTNKLLCSIQAVDKIDNEGLRCLTYTGPVNSLRTAQCPQDIFSTGDCIVLHEGLLSHITSDCATLNVNVTVH